MQGAAGSEFKVCYKPVQPHSNVWVTIGDCKVRMEEFSTRNYCSHTQNTMIGCLEILAPDWSGGWQAGSCGTLRISYSFMTWSTSSIWLSVWVQSQKRSLYLYTNGSRYYSWYQTAWYTIRRPWFSDVPFSHLRDPGIPWMSSCSTKWPIQWPG